MITSLYTTYDKVAGVMHGPFSISGERNDAVAKRIFLSSMGTSEIFKKFPADFDLYYLGKMDSRTGKIESEPEFIMNGGAANE